MGQVQDDRHLRAAEPCQLVKGTGRHVDGDLRAGPPLDQSGEKHLGADPLSLGRSGIGGHPPEDVLCARRLPFDALQDPEEEADIVPSGAGRLGNGADPANDGGHFALLEHLGASGR